MGRPMSEVERLYRPILYTNQQGLHVALHCLKCPTVPSSGGELNSRAPSLTVPLLLG